MKILRLDLLAYGPFTKRALVLPHGGPDLHIIYGPNEAGKSTTLRAISALLYGIEQQTGDAHQHAMADLRIGARLRHSNSEERVFVRKKGKQGTLLDEAGAVIDESSLRSWLSVTDRKQFELMFGLDHVQLRAAGEALTNPRTSLGEMLFGAALNGTALQTALGKMEAEADKLLSPAGSAGAVHKSLAAYRDQLKRVKERALPAKDWKELQDEIEAAEAKRSELSEALVKLKTDQHRLERLQRALPWVRARAEALTERAAMGDVRLLSRDVAQQRREITHALEAAEQSVRKATADIGWARQERDALVVPDELLHAEARIKQLTEDLGKYKTEQKDQPGVIKEIMGFRNREREILRDLGLPTLETSALESIRVSEAAVLRIGALEKTGLQLRAGLDQLRAEVASRRTRLALRTQELTALPAAVDVAVLRSTWSLLRPDRKLDEQASEARAKVAQRTARAQQALVGLAPWQGALEEVAGLAVPSEESVHRSERELDEDEEARRRLVRAQEQRASELEGIRQRIGRLTDAGSVPTEAQLAAARERRELGWSRVQRAWSAKEEPEEIDWEFAPGVSLRAAYGASVQAADELADRLRRESERAAQLAALQREEATALAAIAAATTELAAVEAVAQAHREAWRERWAPCGFAPLSPKEMRAWRKRHVELVEVLRQRDEAAAELAGLERTRDEQRRSLEGGLTLAGVALPAEASWLTLFLHVEHTLSAAEKQAAAEASLRAEVATLEQELASAAAQVTERERALTEWQAQWGEAMGSLRLPPSALPAEANAVLARLDELFREEDRCERQEVRLKAIKKQMKLFDEAVGAQALALAPELVGTTTEVADALIAKHAAAVRDAARRRTLDEQVDKLQRDLQDAELLRETAQHRWDALLRETGCTSREELEAAEERSDRARAIGERQTQAEQRLMEAGEGWSIGSLEQALAETDSDQLETAIARLEEEHKRTDEDRHALGEKVGALRERERQASGRDDAAASVAEAQEHLALARSQAERCARLRLGAAVLRRGVERYRKNHEGAILQRASRLFERLTRGRYEQIQVVYQDDKAKLRCVRRGQLVEVEDALSDGTLDQLFLSLRLASLEQHLDAQEPMPLVLDDIFIHFDDERASAGLEVLAELATKTQVLLLTHHARNLDLARSVLRPEQWTEHRLAGGAASD